MDPDIQIVLCTAYSDYSWDEIARRLGSTDRLVILKKPFDAVEVMQLASALTEKWVLSQRLKSEFQNLEHKVADRTRELRNANQQLQAEIVQHQETEETLRATQEKLTHFLSKSPAILYSFRLENDRILPSWVSENIAGLIGGDVQDWYQEPAGLSWVEESDRAAVTESMKHPAEPGFPSMEYRIRRKDGQSRWVRDDRNLLRDATGRPVEIIGCWTEITEQRLLAGSVEAGAKDGIRRPTGGRSGP